MLNKFYILGALFSGSILCILLANEDYNSWLTKVAILYVFSFATVFLSVFFQKKIGTYRSPTQKETRFLILLGAIWLTAIPATILCVIANKYFDSGWIGNAVIAASFAILFVKIVLVKKSV